MVHQNISIWDYVVFAALLLISGAIGPIYAWLHRKKGPDTSEHYFVGDRGLKVIPAAASLFATFMSAIALVGIPAELYVAGARFFMHTVGQAIGIIIGAVLIVPVFYRLQLISSLEYLELRFGSKSFRVVCSIMTILSYIFTIAVVTYAPCIALDSVTGIPVWVGIVVTSGITMFYSVLGGVKAIVLVDLIQAIVMFAALIVAIVVGFLVIPGGIDRAIEITKLGGRLDFIDGNPDPRDSYSIYAMLIPSILFTAKIYTSSQIAMQKYSAMPTVKHAVVAVLAITPMMIIVKVLLMLLSWAMFAFYQLKGCDPLRGGLISNPNELTTYFITEIVHFPGFIGIWFAGLFSGSLSTMSTAYNSTAALIWEDLLKDRLQNRLSPKWISFVMKTITLIFAIMTCLLAIVFSYYQGTVIQLTIGVGTIFGVSTSIAFIAGSFLPFVNMWGAIAGMISGTMVAIFFGIGQFIGPWYGIQVNRMWLPTRTDQCQAVLSAGVTAGLTIRGNSSPNCSDEILPPWMIQNLFESGMINWPKPCPPTTTPMTLVLADHPANFAMATDLGDNHHGMPDWLVYLFSISVFLYPILAAGVGMALACFVSICTGGIRQAKYVDSRYLIFKNCFSKPKDESIGLKYAAPSSRSSSRKGSVDKDTITRGQDNEAYAEQRDEGGSSGPNRPVRPPSPRFGRHPNKQQQRLKTLQ